MQLVGGVVPSSLIVVVRRETVKAKSYAAVKWLLLLLLFVQTATSRQTQPVSSNTDCRTFALTAEPMADTRHLLSQRVRIPYFLFVAVILLTFL